jgi:Cu2+-exporting ATPase
LGRRSYALPAGESPASAAPETVLSRNGVELAAFVLTERIKDDAVEELSRLRDEGFEVYLLSGDSRPRVEATAARLGIAPDHALAARRPGFGTSTTETPS